MALNASIQRGAPVVWGGDVAVEMLCRSRGALVPGIFWARSMTPSPLSERSPKRSQRKQSSNEGYEELASNVGAKRVDVELSGPRLIYFPRSSAGTDGNASRYTLLRVRECTLYISQH